MQLKDCVLFGGTARAHTSAEVLKVFHRRSRTVGDFMHLKSPFGDFPGAKFDPSALRDSNKCCWPTIH